MPSKSTRYQIIVRALTLAGRDIRLRDQCAEWLNDMLRAWAFEYKYPTLRKIGTPITLSIGSCEANLPDDFGAGSDNVLFGDSRIPIYEKSVDEFVADGGFVQVNQGSGTPSFYMVDREAAKFRFNQIANKDYQFIPVYYKNPDPIPVDSASDTEKVWMENDKLVVEGLIECIYQYTGDVRELAQAQKVIALRDAYRRGVVPVGGGVNKITLSRTAFKRRR